MRTASLTALAAFMLDRRTSIGLPCERQARGRAGRVSSGKLAGVFCARARRRVDRRAAAARGGRGQGAARTLSLNCVLPTLEIPGPDMTAENGVGRREGDRGEEKRVLVRRSWG